MTMRLNRGAWNQMLRENLAWLEAASGNAGPASEKGHIIDILRMLLDVSPAAPDKFVEGQRDERATERHLDKVDPKGELRARWRAIHDELERRESMDTLDRDGPALEAERDKIFEVLFP